MQWLERVVPPLQWLIGAMIDWCNGWLMQWLMQELPPSVANIPTKRGTVQYSTVQYTLSCQNTVVDWCSGWLMQWLIDGMVDWCSGWLMQWLIDTVADWCNGWLMQWLIDAMAGWCNGWLMQWLVDAMVGWCRSSARQSQDIPTKRGTVRGLGLALAVRLKG